MNNKPISVMHWSFWIIGVMTLIWNAMGMINFFVQMNPDMLEAYRESERAIIEGRPAWATAGFAVAVFGGTLGCVLLLLRNSASVPILMTSLLGVVVTMIHTLGLDIVFGLGEILGIILMPLVVAGFLIWYAKQAKSKGWIS